MATCLGEKGRSLQVRVQPQFNGAGAGEGVQGIKGIIGPILDPLSGLDLGNGDGFWRPLLCPKIVGERHGDRIEVTRRFAESRARIEEQAWYAQIPKHACQAIKLQASAAALLGCRVVEQAQRVDAVPPGQALGAENGKMGIDGGLRETQFLGTCQECLREALHMISRAIFDSATGFADYKIKCIRVAAAGLAQRR